MRGYPKWERSFTNVPRFVTVAVNEVRRALVNPWARTALMFAVGYAVITIGGLYSVRTRVGVHTTDALVEFLNLLHWAALAVASTMAGPALLDDHRKGALELYHARGVTRWSYLSGKVLAVWGLAFFAVAAPGFVYWAGSYLVFENHPAGWGWSIFGILGDAALWSLVITGLGLGLSSVARSSRAATLILFGAVAGLDIVFGRILNAITRSGDVLVLSPMASITQQAIWLFPGAKTDYTFTWWWGLLALGILLAIGWGLVWWRHPRLKGVE